MLDHSKKQRRVVIEVTADLVKALGGAVGRTYDKHVSTASCSSCSAKDREKIRTEYETLRGLYDYITDDRNQLTDSGFSQPSGGLPETAQAETATGDPGQCQGQD